MSACQRDDARDVRVRLAKWFDLDRQIYFTSLARCTVAVYAVKEIDPRESLAVTDTPKEAAKAFRNAEVIGIRMADYSPNDLTDAMLLDGDGAFGKEALRAGARSVDCMRGSFVEGHLRTALTRVGATLVFDKATEAVIVLDPVQERLYFIAGDVL